jgi:hypothetical protein
MQGHRIYPGIVFEIKSISSLAALIGLKYRIRLFCFFWLRTELLKGSVLPPPVGAQTEQSFPASEQALLLSGIRSIQKPGKQLRRGIQTFLLV